MLSSEEFFKKVKKMCLYCRELYVEIGASCPFLTLGKERCIAVDIFINEIRRRKEKEKNGKENL